MIYILTIALIACWIGEWSTLIQKLVWFTKWNWVNWFACSKCWGFWLGLIYGYAYRFSAEVIVFDNCFLGRFLVFAILCSATAQVMNKIYMRL